MTQTRNALVFAPEDIVTERNAEPQVRAVSWYPRLMTTGPHLALSPAVFWLVASLKPDCAVTLGLGQGHLFFAVAQGLDKLASDGRAIGIAGSADEAGLIADLTAHLHQLYRDNAQIVPADNSEGMQAGVDLASINLLIVDPARIDPMTAEDAAAWLARMHPDAIIALVGGPADHDNAVTLRLAVKDWQTQHLRVGSGLTLFQCADGLLTAPVFSSAGQNVLRRIGEGLEAIAGRDAAVSALSRRDTQLAEAGAALKVAEARYSQLEAAHHLQGDKRAVLESTLFDQQGENRYLSDRVVALAEAHEQACAEIARLQAESEENKARIVRQADERLILTKIAEEMRGEIERHRRAARKHVQEVRTLKAALKQAKATARAENARRATLQQSLSWRVTAPMRRLHSMFKRR